MNYIETCTKIAVFLWRSSNYRPLTSVLHVRPGWIIYQNMRETWEKKVMKFEREIPIGLDARRKKWQGGAIKAPPPPPNGIRVKDPGSSKVLDALSCWTLFWSILIQNCCRPPPPPPRLDPPLAISAIHCNIRQFNGHFLWRDVLFSHTPWLSCHVFFATPAH